MRQIRSDLWVTSTDNPFPGLNTHAYLWTPRYSDNVLFYSTASDSEFGAIERLGGIAHQYLSHRDEAGPMLGRIAAVFGNELHAPTAELADIEKHATVHHRLDTRHVDSNGVEVIPTPGHSPGSTTYQVRGADGARYVFTGDTLMLGDDGDWFAGYLPDISDPDALATSLGVLQTLEPDWVLSSALVADGGTHEMTSGRWAEAVDQALAKLRAVDRDAAVSY